MFVGDSWKRVRTKEYMRIIQRCQSLEESSLGAKGPGSHGR